MLPWQSTQIWVDRPFKLRRDPQWPFDTWAIQANLTRAQECGAPWPPPPHHAGFLVVVCLIYVVVRFAESLSSFEKMRTRSQASSVIPWCPVTAVYSFRACSCRYPILHLCHSVPMDQQSNFTQARSEGGNADAEMRIYASTKTSCLKRLERRLSWRRERWDQELDKNSNGSAMELDKHTTKIKWGTHFYECV